MARKREKPEDIVLKLWQVEVLHGQGKSGQEAVRQIGAMDLDRGFMALVAASTSDSFGAMVWATPSWTKSAHATSDAGGAGAQTGRVVLAVW